MSGLLGHRERRWYEVFGVSQKESIFARHGNRIVPDRQADGSPKVAIELADSRYSHVLVHSPYLIYFIFQGGVLMFTSKNVGVLLANALVIVFMGMIISGSSGAADNQMEGSLSEVYQILNDLAVGNQEIRSALDSKADQQSVNVLQQDITGVKSTVDNYIDAKLRSRASQQSVNILTKKIAQMQSKLTQVNVAVSNIPVRASANYVWEAALANKNSLLSRDIFPNDGKIRHGSIMIGIVGRENNSPVVNLICKIGNENGSVKIPGKQMLSTDFLCNNIQIEAVDQNDSVTLASIFFSLTFSEYAANQDPKSVWLK